MYYVFEIRHQLRGPIINKTLCNIQIHRSMPNAPRSSARSPREFSCYPSRRLRCSDDAFTGHWTLDSTIKNHRLWLPPRFFHRPFYLWVQQRLFHVPTRSTVILISTTGTLVPWGIELGIVSWRIRTNKFSCITIGEFPAGSWSGHVCASLPEVTAHLSIQ